jgi:hypothetical protein
MKLNTNILFIIMFTAITFVLGFAATDLWAGGKKEMVELDEAEIFFEENATDKDLGIQLFLDGEGWQRIKIYDPRWKKILDVKVHGSVGLIGLTELFSESAEPTYAGEDAEISRQELLDLFTAGTYNIYGRTAEGDWLNGEAELTKVIPCAPDIGVFAEDGTLTVRWRTVRAVVDPEWDPEDEDDPQECIRPPEDFEIIGYEAFFEMEVEDESGEERELVNTATLSPDKTSFTASPEFVEMAAEFRSEGKLVEIKAEVIAVEASNNKGISEEIIWEREDDDDE